MPTAAIKNVDGNEHMMGSIDVAITQSRNIMRNIARNRAEEYAEEYVSVSLGLEDSNPTKQLIKNQYIEIYVERIAEAIK